VLNIQWAAPLEKIKISLKQTGWKKLHTRDYFATLKKVAKQTHVSHQSFLTKLYNDKHPVLEVAKFIDNKTPPIILRLWTADTTLTPNNIPLYIGTIYRDESEKYLFFFHHKISTAPSIDIIKKLLVPKPSPYTWQIKVVDKPLPAKMLDKYSSSINVILLR